MKMDASSSGTKKFGSNEICKELLIDAETCNCLKRLLDDPLDKDLME